MSMSINQVVENHIPCDDIDASKKVLLLSCLDIVDKGINPSSKPKIIKSKKTNDKNEIKNDSKDYVNLNREFKKVHLNGAENITLVLLENYLSILLLKDNKFNKDIDEVTDRCLNLTNVESEILKKHDNMLGQKEIKQLAKRFIHISHHIKHNGDRINLYDSPNALITTLEREGLLIPSNQKGETSYSYSSAFLEKYNKTGLRALPSLDKNENIPSVKLINHFDKLKNDIDSSIYIPIINDEVASILNIPCCYNIDEITYVKISSLNNALNIIFKDTNKKKEILEKYFENAENLSKISIGKLYKKLTDVK